MRIHVPGQAVEFVDLGPTPHVPLLGYATLHGRFVQSVPRPATEPGGASTGRVRAFRERHGGRRAVAA